MSATVLANTHAMFDILLTRWSAADGSEAILSDQGAEHMRQARRLLKETLSRYLPWLDAADVALCERLLQARDADELSEQFFRCFDLMVRVRGTAVAVLRMHELFRLLQPHVTR